MVFRLTPDEYELLEARLASSKALNLSDYVRSAVLGPIPGEPSLADLDEKLDRILDLLNEPVAPPKAKRARPA
jgi:hypothetical protein